MLQPFINLPVQIKIFIMGFFSFFIGLSIYSFINNSIVQIITNIIITLILCVLFYLTDIIYNEKIISILSFIIISIIWISLYLYIYHKNQFYTRRNTFICSPFGTCVNDGYSGQYIGNRDYKYIYNNISSDNIPQNRFSVKNTSKYTITLWIKINSKQLLNYSNSINLIQKGDDFTITIDNKQLLFKIKQNKLILDIIYDKWVHYSFSVDRNILNLYENATLYNTYINDSDIVFSKKELLINKFPGELLYLSYANNCLSSREIYEIYKKELISINKIKYKDHLNKPDVKPSDDDDDDDLRCPN